MPEPTSAVDQLAETFWDRFLELSPISATVNGDDRFDDRLPDPGPNGRALARDLATWVTREARAIPIEGLSVEERITRDMLAVVGDLWVEEDDLRLDILGAVDQNGGPQTLLPQLASIQRTDSPARLAAFEARLRAYPAFMRAFVELLDEGRASGLTVPRIIAERTIAQLDRLLALPPERSPIVQALGHLEAIERDRVAAIVRDEVMPADAAYLAALRGEYLGATRTDPGLWSAPNGDAIYRTSIQHWTTLDADPATIHGIGLEQLEAIELERRVIARTAGCGDDTRAYRESLTTAPSNVPASATELTDRAAADVDRAAAAVRPHFGHTPRSACRVMAVEAFKERDAPPAYYLPPAADGSRPGTYYVNTYDLPTRLYSRLAAVTFHEAVPGHHFQIALEVENTALNRFRRLGSRMLGSAYVEGWGLYVERFADEIGLYRSDAERFGMLDAQAWRAARLVVDTGLHALRWSRDRSIAFLRHEAGLSATDAEIETDRYIAWPGQALTYKLGQLQIERIRREVAARDGARFDLRAFHDALLGHGSLPLSTLARELPNWVAAPD